MDFKKIKLIDILILVVPVIVMLLLTPILPDRVPIHWGREGANGFIDKQYSFLLGVLPFVIYQSIKVKYFNR